MSGTIIYCIRHGKSDAREQNIPIRQTSESPLSAVGRSQAKVAGSELKKHRPDVLLTSPMTRASETADIITGFIPPFPVEIEGLQEIRRPELVYGLPIKSRANLLYKAALKDSVARADMNWRLEDDTEIWPLVLSSLDLPGNYEPSVRSQSWAEFFYDQVVPTKHEILRRHSGQKVVIVSHSNFLAFFIASLVLGDNPEPSSLFATSHFHFLPYGGMAILKQDLTGWTLKHFDQHYNRTR